ncbi:Zn(II)2Cys6 transcription factor domain-containing protein [Aspergillus brunneoviolaceus CBS 621.78]|uniref:Uncharacterized protein n=1 Tax=Aspergillus brunneoviolaceus CBS 621.78 TaxID=1450534 RepID=A0ACD1GMF1_9EURO|nr:hypothetical protein BO95DRAFT_155196 [Aspergillus brunneoviolaceus CBS 621.78]RAH50441.1 hypothetical protein BO95DRAFT_155196 [Aspergillus brunneoviolaceus CBS 621.78]
MAQQGSGSTTAYRPLAPKPTLVPSKRGASDPPEPPGPSKPGNAKKAVKRSPSSCVKCREKRTRCTAYESGVPCTMCRIHQVECILLPHSDRRRKTTMEYMRQQASYYREFLEQFIRLARADDPALIFAAVEIILANHPEDVTRSLLDALLPDDRTPILPEDEELIKPIREREAQAAAAAAAGGSSSGSKSKHGAEPGLESVPE